MKSVKTLRVLFWLLISVCHSHSEPQFHGVDALGLQYQLNDDRPHNLSAKHKIYLRSEPFTNNKCFCIPNDIEFPKINQVNPVGHNLKRLVVYLYKDDNNNSIQINIPNRDKQILIPDMIHETSNGLPSILTEKVNKILNPNTYTPDDENPNVNREYVRVTPRDHRINIYKTFENRTPKQSPGKFRYEYSPVTDKTTYDDINVDPSQNPLINILNFAKPSDEISLREQDKPDFIHIDNEKIPFDSEDIAVDPWQFYIDQKWKSPERPKGDVTNTHIWEEVLPYVDKNENKYEPKDPKTNVHVEHMPRVVEWETITPDFVHKHGFKPVQAITSITFDGWFVNELKRVLMRNSIKNNIDSYTIKYLIKKTLNENGMYIRNDGVLTDSLGIALNWGNLKMRPILIRNSAEYGNLVQGKIGDDLDMAKSVPYMKAVLLTLIYPPKVLGIIPLGMTYLPQESSNIIPVPLDSTLIHKSRFSVHRCSNGNCYSTEVSPDETKIDPYIRMVKDDFETKPSKNDAIQGLNIAQDADFLKSYKKTFPFELVHGIPRFRNFGAYHRVDDKHLILNKKQLGPVKKEYPKEVDKPIEVEEKPGFRIIGGDSATSSGSALNVKGRSGFIPLH